MSGSSSISFTGGLPETVLPPQPPEVERELELAEAASPEARRESFGRVAAAAPKCLEAWAGLAENTESPVERYAFARVGYHRGLDALRAAGWRGSGYVRWSQPANRGFLRCLDELRRAARDIGESEEEDRCALFLRQLDPEWPPPGEAADQTSPHRG